MKKTERLLVMKFGGTSVGSPDAIRQAAKIVTETHAEWSSMVVVLSALSGVTNALLKGVELAVHGEFDKVLTLAEELESRHRQTAGDLIDDPDSLLSCERHFRILFDEFRNLCEAMSVLGESTPRALDAVASLGERLSVQLFASVLQQQGIAAQAVEATQLIKTDHCFQGAHPLWPETRTHTSSTLEPILSRGDIPVVTGFLASTEEGITTTLGRGGSDYSAAILAAALRAKEVWIWTDVDGVMTADPKIVPEAHTIPALSFLELGELAYFGAKVLHPMTIRPVVEAGIGLSIRNTFNPTHPGTILESGSDPIENRETIKAVTAIRGQSLLTLEGRGMLGVPGVAARAFAAVAETGTNVILISQASSEQNISFAIPSDSVAQVLEAVERAFHHELSNREIDRIWASEETVILTIVGSGMRHKPGIAGRIFTTLGNAEVNVMAIAQGSSEVAISLVIDAKDLKPAVRAVHRLIEIPSSK